MKPQMEPWVRSLLVRLVFASWRMVKALTTNQALTAENERLSKAATPTESIWRMRKEELVEVAIAELGVTRTQANAETVIVLRERIRRSRKEQAAEADPLQAVPPGLERMRVEDLVKECTNRQISVAALPGEKGPRMARPQMMIAIRDDVARRQTESKEDDWHMTVDTDKMDTDKMESGSASKEEKSPPGTVLEGACEGPAGLPKRIGPMGHVPGEGNWSAYSRCRGNSTAGSAAQ